MHSFVATKIGGVGERGGDETRLIAKGFELHPCK